MPKRFTKEEFIKRARERHGNKYDYSKAEYINADSKVCIICPKHGEFWQRVSDHIRGCGCPECSGVKRNTLEGFIEKSRRLYGDKYDYSKVEYVNNKVKVCIICPEHGEFWQRPNDHLSGYECQKCKKSYSPTTEEWIEKVRKIHGDKYDYSKAKYIRAWSKVCIICPKHGEFWQAAINHSYGAGCPYCNCGKKSKMEEAVNDMLVKSNLDFERQKTFDWLKYKKHLYLDFYLDKYQIAIEVQGEQHFRSIMRYGGETDFQLRKKRDEVKKELCNKHGIKLFYITKRNFSINEVVEYINKKKID